jgi:hypothetical protein
MRSILLLIILIALSFYGCANTPITLNYSPSSIKTVNGSLNVGDFEYLPSKDNKILPNQVRNTAASELFFEKNIDQYFEEALFKELRFVGINLNKSKTVVSGQIIEFFIDDLGFSIDWVLEVNYIVKRNDGKAICFNKTYRIEKTTQKFAAPLGVYNEIIKLNIEQMFNDKEFVNCIRSQS